MGYLVIPHTFDLDSSRSSGHYSAILAKLRAMKAIPIAKDDKVREYLTRIVACIQRHPKMDITGTILELPAHFWNEYIVISNPYVDPTISTFSEFREMILFRNQTDDPMLIVARRSSCEWGIEHNNLIHFLLMWSMHQYPVKITMGREGQKIYAGEIEVVHAYYKFLCGMEPDNSLPPVELHLGYMPESEYILNAMLQFTRLLLTPPWIYSEDDQRDFETLVGGLYWGVYAQGLRMVLHTLQYLLPNLPRVPTCLQHYPSWEDMEKVLGELKERELRSLPPPSQYNNDWIF
jgi:hypothetical protein